MNFKEFNKENSGAVRSGDIIVSFNVSSGLVSFSKTATETFKLNAGMEIVIVQDEENPEDWYFAQKEGGFTLRQDRGTEKRLAFNNTKTRVS